MLFGAKYLTPWTVTVAVLTNIRSIAAFLNERVCRLGKEEECVQFPAGLSEMGNTNGTPCRYKVTAAAAYWFTNEIGFEDELLRGTKKGRQAYQPLTHSHTWRRMGFWK
jgi:hypothetical protein